jgi:hypothetical protein
MSDNQNFGFGKFIPGFDFLQNLAKGASQTLPQMPNLSNWVAPTLNLEELERRIGELKAVHFWLDQNSKALGATIQALEVQKMTLATLRGMNFNMGEVAEALKLKPVETKPGGAGSPQVPGEAAPEAVAAPARPKASRKTATKGAGQPAGGVVDPLQWWGALTQQFQQIASGAMKDVAAQAATSDTPATGSGSDGAAVKSAGAGRPSGSGSGKSAARRKAPARKAQNR